MRIRHIKPEFYRDEKLCQHTHTERLLFLGLWAMADKNGCLKNSPVRIAADVFPFDEFFKLDDNDSTIYATSEGLKSDIKKSQKSLQRNSEVTAQKLNRHIIRPAEAIMAMLERLASGGFLKLYDDAEGQPSIWIKNFIKHQKLTYWEENSSELAAIPPPEFEAASKKYKSDFKKNKKSLQKKSKVTSKISSPELNEKIEENENIEIPEGDLQQQIKKFQNCHPACKRVSGNIIRDIISGYPDADVDEAINAFACDRAGSEFGHFTTPQKEFRRYLADSQRQRTGRYSQREVSKSRDEEPEDLNHVVLRAMKEKQRREAAQKREAATSAPIASP